MFNSRLLWPLVALLYFFVMPACASTLPALASISDIVQNGIRMTESSDYPWTIDDDTTHEEYGKDFGAPTLQSESQAITLAKALLARGHNIDMGEYQINSIHLGCTAGVDCSGTQSPNGLSANTIFDVSVNEQESEHILSEFYTQAEAIYGPGWIAMEHAIAAYNDGTAAITGDADGVYLNKVLMFMGSPVPNLIGTTQGQAPTAPTSGAALGGMGVVADNEALVSSLTGHGGRFGNSQLPANSAMALAPSTTPSTHAPSVTSKQSSKEQTIGTIKLIAVMAVLIIVILLAWEVIVPLLLVLLESLGTLAATQGARMAGKVALKTGKAVAKSAVKTAAHGAAHEGAHALHGVTDQITQVANHTPGSEDNANG